ncbi:hypothetical protein KNO15_19560 [Leifsonia shinshuensis]|uniref:hypothetical protein n=1 Tax=Leifsonia shinshuensis TaxID=150026 RepID=UPI001F509BD7|nr:hypothetical protein [Leifsonia shinshuensis]MCI0158905.1 hypothetical protein [Leifsonia shinshuensis]
MMAARWGNVVPTCSRMPAGMSFSRGVERGARVGAVESFVRAARVNGREAPTFRIGGRSTVGVDNMTQGWNVKWNDSGQGQLVDLRTSAGWRRLGLSTLVVAAPVGLSMFGFLLFDIQGFMQSGWAIWVLLACLFVPYALGYTADMLRRREARRGEEPAGDASPLVLVRGASGVGPIGESSLSRRGARSSNLWIWVGLVLVIAYAVFRIVWALANGAVFDWTAVIALVALAAVAIILPSATTWQRFRRSAGMIGGSAVAWPTFRTDQFAAELHRSRPGATIPQDLILSASESAVSVWTTEREPKLLVSLPRDATTTIRAAKIRDRLGSTGIRIDHQEGADEYAFELVVRRRGIFTYFRTDQTTAEMCASEIVSARPSEPKR